MIAALAATTAATLMLATPARSHYDHSLFSYSSCSGNIVDPVTFVMYGTQATALQTQQHVQFHTTWQDVINGTNGQYGKDHGNCTEFDRNNASGCATCSRYHVRWNQGGELGHDNYRYSVGTPHYEQFGGSGCIVPPNHHVISFVDGRNVLGSFMPSHHARFYRYDGSTTRVRQCNGALVGGDGAVLWMRLDAS